MSEREQKKSVEQFENLQSVLSSEQKNSNQTHDRSRSWTRCNQSVRLQSSSRTRSLSIIHNEVTRKGSTMSCTTFEKKIYAEENDRVASGLVRSRDQIVILNPHDDVGWYHDEELNPISAKNFLDSQVDPDTFCDIIKIEK